MAKGKAGGKSSPAADMRRGRAVAVARLVPSLARRAYRQRGFVSGEVIARWAEIAGADVAAVSRPLKLAFAPGRRDEGVLHVKASSAAALQLQHRSPVILERINAHFGYKAVARLALTQGPVAEGAASPPAPVAPPSPDSRQSARLDALARQVNDDRLGALLRRWGAHILHRDGT